MRCLASQRAWTFRAESAKSLQTEMLSSRREAAELSKQHDLSPMMPDEVCRTSCGTIGTLGKSRGFLPQLQCGPPLAALQARTRLDSWVQVQTIDFPVVMETSCMVAVISKPELCSMADHAFWKPHVA